MSVAGWEVLLARLPRAPNGLLDLREFHRRTNYTAAGRPWLLAFEISAVVAWLAWVVLLMRR